MSENKLNVVVPKDYNGTPIEVVLREGTAPEQLEIKEPERVMIDGTIDAPYRWLEKRIDLINQKSSNIIVNRDKMGMILTINETNYYQDVITGVLQPSKEMVDGRDVSLSLVSAGANEAIEEYKNKVIDEQLDAIRQIAPDIVIIEV